MAESQDIRESRLSNGVRVVTEALRDRRGVSLGFWVDVGSRDEEDEAQGCSHFIEHMLFKGTANRTAEEISRAIEAGGGELNAFTDREFTCVTAQVLGRDVDLAVDVIADMLQGAALDEEDIEREKAVVSAEIGRRNDNPEILIQDLYPRAVWGSNPAARSVLGTVETLKGLAPPYVRGYLRENYTPNRIVVSAAGAVNHERLVESVESRLSEKGRSSHPKRQTPTYRRGILLEERDVRQVQLCIVAEGAPYAERPWYAAALLSSYLGEGSSSRLFNEVRERRGLVYSVFTQQLALGDGGLLGVFAGTSLDKVEEVMGTILGEFDRVRGSGMDPAELEMVKRKVEGELSLSMDSVEARMYGLGVSTLRLGRPLSLEEVVGKVRAVTLAEVRELSEKILDRDSLSVVALGPSREIARKIGGGLASP